MVVVRAEIVAAVKFARTLSLAEKTNILASLSYQAGSGVGV